MKNHAKAIIGIILIAFILVAVINYRGLPVDCLENREERDITSSDFTFVNGVEISESQFRNAISDAYIVLKNEPHIRTLIIDVSNIETNADIMMCTVWFGTEQDGFWEMNNESKELQIGQNRFVVPYDGKYNEIRIDFGEQEGEIVTINSIRAINKFADWRNYITDVLLVTMVLLAIYILFLFFKSYGTQIEALDQTIWEKFIWPFRKLYLDISRFCSRNRAALLSLIVFAIVLYGGYFFNYTLSIDEENFQANANEYLVFVSSGRFFLGLLVKIFGNSPFFNVIAGGLMMFIAAIILCSLLDHYKRCTQFSCFITCGLFMSMPYVIGETLNFSMQGMHIAMGYILVALALYVFSYVDLQQNRKENFTLSFWAALLFVFSLGIYQSFVTVFIFLVSAISMLIIESGAEISKTMKFIFKNIIFLICAMVIYEGIVYLCHKFIASDNGYLGGFVGWNKSQSNLWVWQNVVSNLIKVIKGEYYNQTAGSILKVSVLLYLAYSIYLLITHKKGKKILLFIIEFSLVIIPFLIPLCTGSFILLGRSLNALPIFLAFIWFQILNDINKYKFIKAAGWSVAILLLIFQTKYYNEFVYADQLRYQQDIELAGAIMTEINRVVENTDKPLVFVGTHSVDYKGNLSNVNGCESFFAFQNGNNLRILNFLNLSGYKVMYPTGEQINDAMQSAVELTEWPKAGCIEEKEEYILIKLGNI